jgi:hypothetical protein
MKRKMDPDDFVIVEHPKKCKAENQEYLNDVERLLKKHGVLGLSVKSLSKILGISRKAVKYQIINSTYISDVAPILHGSNKQKINVYRYNDIKKRYFERRKKEKKQITEGPEEPVGI